MSTFWMTMRYQCTGHPARAPWGGHANPPPGFEEWKDPRPAEPAYPGCGYQAVFYLEDGCEGPGKRDGRHTTVISDRVIVPVPFVAGRCPQCGRGDLTHVRWNEDQILDPAIPGPLEVPHFTYPTPDEFAKFGDRACGHPVYSKLGWDPTYKDQMNV